MEKYIYDESNGLWYERQVDYYIPCLSLPEKEEHPMVTALSTIFTKRSHIIGTILKNGYERGLLHRPFVQYEICQSLQRNNGVIGVYIHGIRDMITKQTSSRGIAHTIIGQYSDGRPAYFDEICDGIYDYTTQDGYNNLGVWIELAAQKHGR